MEDTIYDVLIIGGGTSGLVAAHELAEKNLKVCVLEAAPFVGGKPIAALGNPLKTIKRNASKEEVEAFLKSKAEENTSLKNTLPVEHGFRVYPENYNNLLSIMRRIPVENGQNVSDYLTNVIHLASYINEFKGNRRWRDKLLAKLEKVLFGLALYTPYILCQERSLKYDEVAISDLFQIQNRSPELQALILCLTDSLSSGMLTYASSLAITNILMNYYYAPNRTGFRTFDRPTHIAWINPWEKYLRKLGVTFHLNTKVTNFNLGNIQEDTTKGACVNSVIATQNDKQVVFKAKYIICATPADVLQKFLQQNYEMIRYEPRFLDLYKVVTLPATGVQLYFEKPIKGIEQKLLAGSMITHPWGISYVDQNSYWTDPEKYTGPYGVISIYVSITNQVGRYVNKPLQKCLANEIAYEMFSEVENELRMRNIDIPERVGYFAHSYQHEPYLSKTDDNPVLEYHFNGTHSEDLLHLCVVGMHKWRPLPETLYLQNMVLCGSYTRNNTYYVSTMEAASESGRRAASTILTSLGMQPLTIYQIEAPRTVRILRKFDKFLYTLWLPNPIDLLLSLLRRVVKSKHIHMDPTIRSYENLHW